MALSHPPILAHTLKMNTEEPCLMTDLVTAARDAEAREGVQAATIFGGFPIADIPEAGVSVVTVAEESGTAQSVADNLTMALRANRGPFAVLFWKPTCDTARRVAELADEVGLADQTDRRAGELSHGQKQWLEIGMLLAQEPRLLLVDEPAAGMTLAEREQTTTLLKRLAQTRAVVVVEHDMDFVRRLDCKVTVLHQGAVLAEGSLDHVTRNPDVIEVYLGR